MRFSRPGVATVFLAIAGGFSGCATGGTAGSGAAAAAAYFSTLGSNSGVVALPSGLRYEILVPGSGRPPRPTDTVSAYFEGRLIDGTVFDRLLRPREPFEFPLDGVIAGWREGLQKISPGGKIRLHIPPDLGYRDTARPGIPANSILVFDIELVAINPGAAK